jgi:hypothetical protein
MFEFPATGETFLWNYVDEEDQDDERAALPRLRALAEIDSKAPSLC